MFVHLTKDTTYLTGNEGQKICGVISETAQANMQIHGMAYHGLVDPRALRTSEAPEDATQGVYRLSHAI